MSRVVSVTVVLLVATASGGSVIPVTSDPVEIAPGGRRLHPVCVCVNVCVCACVCVIK